MFCTRILLRLLNHVTETIQMAEDRDFRLSYNRHHPSCVLVASWLRCWSCILKITGSNRTLCKFVLKFKKCYICIFLKARYFAKCDENKLSLFFPSPPPPPPRRRITGSNVSALERIRADCQEKQHILGQCA
jgi:hypothetical protein